VGSDVPVDEEDGDVVGVVDDLAHCVVGRQDVLVAQVIQLLLGASASEQEGEDGQQDLIIS
jgi:hypothetical protein